MYDAPIGITRWFTGQDWNGLKKLMYSGGIEWVLSQVNVTPQLEFELTMIYITVQPVSYYTTGIPSEGYSSR